MYSQYFATVSRHKWFVLLECIKMAKQTKTPMLIWRGLTHDLSKFRPSEFFPYARYFNGDIKTKTINEAFDKAWLLHQKRNSHHWQWHILRCDDGQTKVFDMASLDRMEMLCDWRGAGRAYGNPDTARWYKQNNHSMVLSVCTRWWIQDNIVREV
jgi:hypothetical protein